MIKISNKYELRRAISEVQLVFDKLHKTELHKKINRNFREKVLTLSIANKFKEQLQKENKNMLFKYNQQAAILAISASLHSNVNEDSASAVLFAFAATHNIISIGELCLGIKNIKISNTIFSNSTIVSDYYPYPLRDELCYTVEDFATYLNFLNQRMPFFAYEEAFENWSREKSNNPHYSLLHYVKIIENIIDKYGKDLQSEPIKREVKPVIENPFWGLMRR